MIAAPTLRGRHIFLRPLAAEDAALTLAWRLSARAVHLNTGATTVAAQAAWIASRPTSEFNFVIALTDGKPVGMISLTDVDTVNRHAMPGRFLIGEEAAVRGLPAAAEAMGLLLAFAFDDLGLRRIHGFIASDNHLMIKWQKFIGLTMEGTFRDHLFINGHFQDAICFGLLDDEYRRTTIPRIESLLRMAHPTPQ